MNFVRTHVREVLIGALVILLLWAYRSLVMGDMREEIARLSLPDGLPARRELWAGVRRMQLDARVVASRLDAVRNSPSMGQSLAATLERFHKERGLSRDRSRLIPRETVMLEGNIQQEQIDVIVNGMSLQEIIQYLSGLEILGSALRIRTLRLQKAGDTATMTLTVGALRVPAP